MANYNYVTRRETLAEAIRYSENHPDIPKTIVINMYIDIETKVNQLIDAGYSREEIVAAAKNH